MSAPLELPTPVARAFDVSRRSGYVSFCRNETGRLLATLAATRTGTLAEFGTGCGVGTAWHCPQDRHRRGPAAPAVEPLIKVVTTAATEPNPPADWPEECVGTLTTHDLPTLRGFW